MTPIEKAKVTNIVPAMEANKAFLAVESFDGSPAEDKKETPVTTQRILTIPVATNHTNFATFATKPEIVMFAVTCAKVMLGKTKTPIK